MDRQPGSHRAPSASWIDSIYAKRDKLLSDPKFQRWLASFPLTRPFAQREARGVFDVCAGFVYTQVLLACVRLKLFEDLQKGPKTLTELCESLSLQREPAAKLLKAATALRFLSRRSGDRYGLGTRGAAVLGNPSIATMVEHHALLYADLHDPVALLRGQASQTHLAQYWTYAGNSDAAATDQTAAATYSGLMSATQALVADDILDAYPMAAHRCLLDIGGGEGQFISAVAARHQSIALKMFDLPPVADRARISLQNKGLDQRIEVTGGSFFTDPLPQGADIVSLVRICFDHSDASVLAIFRSIRKALPQDGVLLIAEPISGDASTAAITDAYYGFYLLSMGGGKTRTLAEFASLAAQAGFSRSAQIPTRRPMLTGLIEIRP